MSAEHNEAVVRRFVEEGINQQKIEAIHDEIAAPGLVLEAPGLPTAAGQANGYELFKQSVVGFVDAFPDVQCTIPFLVAEGDAVAADLAYHGTQEKDFAGVPATHEHVKGGELWFFEFEGGKIKSCRICEYGVPLRAALIAAGSHGAHP
jgi:predicted ester cyclase